MRVVAGQWVEVRSKEEILATLDKSGRLDGLPFQPQMFNYCGKRLRVFKRAHKTCDWVYDTGARALEGGVHLDGVRCDGAAYGGCQSACLLYWKEAWLKPVDEAAPAPAASGAGCSEADVLAYTQHRDDAGELFYRCQATDVPNFTTPLPWWNLRQYAEDVSSGNATPFDIVKSLTYFGYSKFAAPHRPRGAPARWLYNQVMKLFGGVPYPEQSGRAPRGKTPLAPVKLDLKPGDWVRVKSYEEILETLDSNQKNRGLYFDKETVPYCGGVYRVSHKVTNFLDEKTGKPMKLKTDAVVLENVWCRARFSDRRIACPRSIYPWWRDIWLERVEPPDEASQIGASGQQ